MEVRNYYQRPDGRICFLEDLVPAAGNEIRFRWRLCRPRSGWRGDGDMGLLVNPMQETEDTFCLRPVDCRGWKWLHTGCDSCRYRRRVSVGTIYMARGLPMTEASNDGWYNRCILRDELGVGEGGRLFVGCCFRSADASVPVQDIFAADWTDEVERLCRKLFLRGFDGGWQPRAFYACVPAQRCTLTPSELAAFLRFGGEGRVFMITMEALNALYSGQPTAGAAVGLPARGLTVEVYYRLIVAEGYELMLLQDGELGLLQHENTWLIVGHSDKVNAFMKFLR